ncbi:hypothetical protein J3B02_002513, partial [Coemansia erecta]
NFRFKTRIQQLNSLEGKTRSNLNYQDQLYKFHAQQGQPLIKVPQLDHRPIDLYDLRNEVAARGGYQKVNGGKRWAEIGRVLKYDRKTCTSMSNSLKSTYQKIILPFELYIARHGGSSDTQPFKSTVTDISSGGVRQSKRRRASISASVSGSASDVDTPAAAPVSATGSVIPERCEVCKSGENDEQMLICDGCDRGFHMYCLNPPLSAIPNNDWYCDSCVLGTSTDFGFEDGAEYTLESFKRKGDEFKRKFFSRYYASSTTAAIDDAIVPEDEVEREFWRLVASPYEDVEVEYGADLHSAQHGSGFPTVERDPLEPYARHPWNLNVLPFQPASLFNHISQDISGMMTPWIYVGMCFSTFCWHNEDHYTYSVNYMHWGETKTWYGVPGAHAARFEDAMRAAVPQLFADQPDLLLQLVTMLSPEVLVKRGVHVVSCDQRAGEFVVTFPQSYHAGFNQGVNFNEAVNFATPDWLPFDMPSVRRYQRYGRNPVFSHDELIVTMASQYNSEHWFRVAATEMATRELADRARVRQAGIRREAAWHTVDEGDPELPDEIRQQCVHCKAFAYLSAVLCSCTPNYISCLSHFEKGCRCNPGHKLLKVRYTDSELRAMLGTTENLAAAPFRETSRAHIWESEFRRLMSAPASPEASVVTSTTSTTAATAVENTGDQQSKKQAPESKDSAKSVRKPTIALADLRFRPELTQMVVLLEEAHRLVIQDSETFPADMYNALPASASSANGNGGASASSVASPATPALPSRGRNRGRGRGRGRGRSRGRGAGRPRGRGRGARNGSSRGAKSTRGPGRPPATHAAISFSEQIKAAGSSNDALQSPSTSTSASNPSASSDPVAFITREIEQLILAYGGNNGSESELDDVEDTSAADLQILADVRQLSHFVQKAQDWCRAVQAVLMSMGQRRLVERIVAQNQLRYKFHRQQLESRFNDLLAKIAHVYDQEEAFEFDLDAKPEIFSLNQPLTLQTQQSSDTPSVKRERRYRTDSGEEEDADQSSSGVDDDSEDGDFRIVGVPSGARRGRKRRKRNGSISANVASASTSVAVAPAPAAAAATNTITPRRRGRPPKAMAAAGDVASIRQRSHSPQVLIAPPALSTRSASDLSRMRNESLSSPTNPFGAIPELRSMSPAKGEQGNGLQPGSIFRHSLIYYYTKTQLAASVQRVLGDGAGGSSASTSPVYTLDDVAELLRLGDQLFFDSAEFEVLLDYEKDAFNLVAIADDFIDTSAAEINGMADVLMKTPTNSPDYLDRKRAFLARISEIDNAMRAHGLDASEAGAVNQLRNVFLWSERCAMFFKYNKHSNESMTEHISDAKRLGIDEKINQFVKLQEIREQVDAWVSAATEIMQGKNQIDLRQVGKLLEKGRNMLFLPRDYDDLRALQQNALDLQANTDKIVDRSESSELVQRPRYSEAVNLLKESRSFGRFEPSNLDRLCEEIDKVDQWAAETRSLFEPVARHHAVPVDKVLACVQSHLRRAIDAINSESQGNAKADDSAAQYCMCLQPEYGLMVECEHCREWYHTGCIGLETEDIDTYQFVCPMCTAASMGEKRLDLMDGYLQLDRIENAVTNCRKLGLISPELDPLVTFLLDAWSLAKNIKGLLAKDIADQSEDMLAKRAGLLRTTLRAMLGLGISLGQGIVDDLWKQLQAITKGKPLATLATMPGIAPTSSRVQLVPLLPEQQQKQQQQNQQQNQQNQQINKADQSMPQLSSKDIYSAQYKNTNSLSEAAAAAQNEVKAETGGNSAGTVHIAVTSPAATATAPATIPATMKSAAAESKRNNDGLSEVSVSDFYQEQLERLVYLILKPPSEKNEHGQGLVSAGDAFTSDSENCICNVFGSELSESVFDVNDVRCAAAPVIQCDSCREYFHTKCAQVPPTIGRLVFLHQMKRSLNADIDADIPQGPEDYTCPSCCYNLNKTYPYGEIFIE